MFLLFVALAGIIIGVAGFIAAGCERAARRKLGILEGNDAQRLLESLKNVASPEVIKERQEKARQDIAELMRPKGYEPKPK